VVVAVLVVSGALTAWIGVRDGFVRRRMVTNAVTLSGRGAILAGAVYLAFGLAGVAGGVLFALKGR
jgi:hypothetical protein